MGDLTVSECLKAGTSQPSREEIAALSELYRPQINSDLLGIIQRNTIALSLLYDLDLLPEQLAAQEQMTVRLFAAYNRLEGVLLAFKALEIRERAMASASGSV